MRQVEQHGVHEHRLLLGVETREHAAHVWDLYVALMKPGLLLHQQRAVRDGRVHVRLFVVIQAHHVAFGDEMQQDRRQEREEADETAERHLHREAAHTEARPHEDEGHDAQTEHTAGVREKLHTCKSNTSMMSPQYHRFQPITGSLQTTNR